MAPPTDRDAESAFDNAGEAYEKLDSAWQGFRWRITGPVLMAIGVSQAIFGWAGDSWWMRIGYSAACIVFGAVLIAKIRWFVPESDDEPPPFKASPESHEAD